jgi:hypothetical protein
LLVLLLKLAILLQLVPVLALVLLLTLHLDPPLLEVLDQSLLDQLELEQLALEPLVPLLMLNQVEAMVLELLLEPLMLLLSMDNLQSVVELDSVLLQDKVLQLLMPVLVQALQLPQETLPLLLALLWTLVQTQLPKETLAQCQEVLSVFQETA